MKELEEQLYGIVQMLKTQLNLLKEGGLSYIPKHQGIEVSNYTDSRPLIEKEDLGTILKDLGNCQRCKLCRGRTNLVFGTGDKGASLVFVGEGPGAEEDRQGEPFVGRAGQLLTKMINAMGFERQQVYICNVVKCRPPNNRDPERDEIDACEPFLKRQLFAINPTVIVGLGRYACQTLLKVDTPMSKIRGQWQRYEGIRFMPTYHPAYLLRNPSAKKEVWKDLKLVLDELSLYKKEGRSECDPLN